MCPKYINKLEKNEVEHKHHFFLRKKLRTSPQLGTKVFYGAAPTEIGGSTSHAEERHQESPTQLQIQARVGSLGYHVAHEPPSGQRGEEEMRADPAGHQTGSRNKGTRPRKARITHQGTKEPSSPRYPIREGGSDAVATRRERRRRRNGEAASQELRHDPNRQGVWGAE
jgi:hypothetical protein